MTGKTIRGFAVIAAVSLAIGAEATYAANSASKGLSAAFHTTGAGTLVVANYTEFVRLSLPAGKYLIVGKGLVVNQQATSGTAACNMLSGGTSLDTSDAALPAAAIIGTPSYATLAFNAAVDLPTGGDVRIECISTGPDMPGSFSLSALSIRGLTLQ